MKIFPEVIAIFFSTCLYPDPPPPRNSNMKMYGPAMSVVKTPNGERQFGAIKITTFNEGLEKTEILHACTRTPPLTLC